MDALTKDERKAQRKEEWQEQMKLQQRKSLINKILLWGGGAVLVIAAFWAIITFTGSSGQSQPLIDHMPTVTANDLQTGSANAKVTLTEYADFQCPGCGAFHPILKRLLSDFNPPTGGQAGKIHFVYRTFPLTQIHKNAMTSAQAAVAANQQGKFWPMHDMLFEHQSDWANLDDPTPVFDSYAQKLGLDMPKYHQDYTSAAVKKFITDEENGGISVGVPGTPTFFINGKQIQTPTSYEEFKQIIQDKLNSK